MDKFGLLSSGRSITFKAHLEHLDPQRKELMLELRRFAKSLGANVIEEVRPHRVVYAKTLTFRTFLDIEPAGDRLVIEIRGERGEPPARLEVTEQSSLEEAEIQIAQAYEKIR